MSAITKINYVHNGIKYYHEFEYNIPDISIPNSNGEDNFLTNYDGPSDLWQKIINSDSGYKLCKNDGPALIHANGVSAWQSSKCKRASYKPINFSKNTNHILCKYCSNFCKQMCFIL